MTDPKQRVAGLSPEKQLLVELLRREKKRGPSAVESEIPKLPPFSLISEVDRTKLGVDLEDAYPLTRMQAGMIFHMELTPDYPLYHNVDSWHLRARFVADFFQEAVQRAVGRHEVLRTSFDLGNFSEPLQVVHRSAFLAVGVEDLRPLGAAEQAAVLETFVDEQKRQRFDLGKPPLLRFHIHIRSDESFQFTLTLFHPILDGWSLQATLADIIRDYSALLRGEALGPEPLLAARFRDFVYLEQQALRSDEARRFWVEHLRGMTVLELPRWPGVGAEGRERAFQSSQVPLTSLSFDDLRAFSRQVGVPLKSLFLAAHCKVLGLETGLYDVVTGLTVQGRPEGADGELVRGLFVNTLPLRIDLEGGSWEDLARRAFEGERALLPFRRFPFAEIKKLAEQPELLETALNVVHFHVMENVVRSDFEVSALAGSRELDETNFALLATFGIDPSGRNLQLVLQSDRTRISDDQAAQIAGRFAAVLAAMVLRPLTRHDTTDLLSSAERSALLYDERAKLSPEVANASLRVRIEAQVRIARDSVAVTFLDRALSYGELWDRSGALAKRLPFGAEKRIGVLLERSLELVVAQLAVIRAGGAYVPLDPSYPAERLSFILEDAGVAAVIVGGMELITDSSVPLIRIEGLKDSGTAIEVPAYHPDQAAYVIYTSGSTGRPKGVVVSHSNVCRLFDATEPWFAFSCGDVWSLFHSFAFDFSVWEIFGALLFGGRLVVVPRTVTRSTEDFHRLLAEERVTFLNQTPSAFRQLLAVELAASSYVLALREVVFGGEALDLASLAPWFIRCAEQGPRLVNMYGITETTVHVTYRPLAAGDLGARSLIGIPIPDLEIRLLDRAGNLAAVGVPAEIYVGGRGLARGYLGRPDLTAERFVPDPFADRSGARLYRSGDLARRLPSGELEYLGRCDDQVKVRGFRIEPGEIEAALTSYPDVRGALVMIHRESSSEGGRLLAYVESPLDGPGLIEPLRAHLRQFLPEYMMPALIMPLRAFPLTANGKINRSALPAASWGREEIGAPYEPPSNVIEEILAATWSTVLRVERVGVRDNFFALGGDSIRILQVLTKARQEGLRLELQQFYETETLGQLASAVAEHLSVNEANQLVEGFGIGDGSDEGELHTKPFGLVAEADLQLLPVWVEDAYPLTRLQAGMIFHMMMLGDFPVYHNVDSMHLRAHFVEAPFREAVARVVHRHAVLRTSFHLTGFSEPLQLVHREATPRIRVDDLSQFSTQEQETTIRSYVDSERRNRFDLGLPPLIRFQIHIRGEDSCQLTFTELHPILDGWSLQSTLNEIMEVYAALVEGKTLPVAAPIALTFRDYVALERRALESEESRRFWRESLAGATPLRLPRWPGVVDVSLSGRVGEALLPLSHRLLELRHLARSLGVPLKSVVLAAHCKVMGVSCGVEDVVTGLVIHGRPEGGGAEDIRGLFLNTVPLRLDVNVGTWTQLVRAAFAAERSVMPHRRFPLAEIQRSWGRETLVEVGLNFTHFHVLHRSEDQPERDTEVAILSGNIHNETNFPFSVTFGIDPSGARLIVTLASDLGLISAPQLAVIARRYSAVIDALVGDFEADPRHCSLLAPSEIQQMVLEWNDTASARPASMLVHQLFANRAAMQRDAVAMVAEGFFLTYGELDARTDAAAACLRGAGVGPDRVVALCGDRSPELIAASLAVLKAGGAYLPLDPATPLERQRGIVADSGAQIAIGDDLSHLEAIRGETQAIDLFELFARSNDEVSPTSEARFVPSPDSLCYLIYTSGSTGMPKGTLLAHEGLARASFTYDRYFLMAPGKRMLQFSSFAFDAAATEIWVVLFAGGELHFAPHTELLSVQRLPVLLAEREITAAVMPPSILLALRPQPLPALEVLMAVGEACPESLVADWGKGRRLINAYGPTEITMGCTASYNHVAGAKPTIGRPLSDRTVYVVDRDLNPVSMSSPGELVIGGIGLARGYLSLPALTAERFVPDPFSGEPGARLYRSGDLARFLPTGELDFLGRFDRQVKVRGFRVELGEIEAALLNHPGIGEAAVVALGDRPGDTRLVAYLSPPQDRSVGEVGNDISIADVRSFLRATLPEFMVPNVWVKLDVLPHTSSGKIDRKALPPAHAERDGGSSFLPPRNDLERRLVAVFCAELQVEKVGVDDNIFDLGGHSLMMMRLHGQLVDLGFELTITHLFQYPSVGALAEFLSGVDLATAAEEGEERAEQRRSTAQLRGELRQRRRRARIGDAMGEEGELGE